MNEKKYNFNEIIDRKGTGSLKIDALKERYGRDDLLGLWVADMDFKTGDFITEAITKRCKNGILGYTVPSDNYYNSIIRWVESQYGWVIQREWISYIPGIVKGIAFAIQCFSKPLDKIIIQPPVYHPFRLIPSRLHRKVVNNPLIEENGKYRMDLEGLRKMIDKDCKMLILSNPHNPIGIAWDKETLEELADICYKRYIMVISDEIHADMALFGNKHVPFATVSPKAALNNITFMSPSKTFNLAGVMTSHSIIPDVEIRKTYYEFLQAGELNEGPIFAYAATEAAYEKGHAWRSQMLKYVEGNIMFADKYLKENIPQIKAIIPESSFLLWLDCRELGLKQYELAFLFINWARLALNNGVMFGQEGEGFMRMNVGTPRAILKQALVQLKEAVDSHTKKLVVRE
ncbi:MAG: PatB family C-S lyase [Candidatus Azobacteroides sp.]|nr:PatB family C-S lyase [Candidatus Azobacteroides sp.]